MSTKTAQSKAHQQGKSASSTTALPVAPVTRGKRKLSFSTSSKSDIHFFRGKKLFLDLPGYNKIDQIEYELTERGGTVERRFHSGVKYLITNRPKNGRMSGGGSQLDSPSTPSPNTPSGVSTRGGGGLRAVSKFSPCAGSPGSVTPLTDNPVSSRAAMILAASKGKKKSTNLRALAESWGCKVLSLNELLKELRKLKPLPKKQETTKKSPVVKVRKLRPPFLKVEDLSYSYRPLVYETRQWPRPDLKCSPKGCPFDPPKQGRGHHHTSPREGAAAIGRVAKDASSPEAAQVQPPAMEERRRPGYCECCSLRYGDLSLHLKSVKHLEYAHNNANFTSLDDIIAKGKSLAEFVSSVRATYLNPTPSTPRRSSPRKPASPFSGRSPNKLTGRFTVKSPARSPPRADQSKEIVIDSTGVILSPKRGQLCLTPVKDPLTIRVTPTPVVEMKSSNKEYTPGFNTPSPKSASRKVRRGGSRIDPVTRALLQNTCRVNTRLRAQTEREAERVGVVTRSKTPMRQEQPCSSDIVPETPEKYHTRAANRFNSPLVNLKSLVDRIAAKQKALSKASVKQRKVLMSDLQALVEEVSRCSPTSPVHSTSLTPSISPSIRVRKSPRLAERELLRFRPSKTEKAPKWFTTYGPQSLVVSYNLSRIYPRNKPRSVAAPADRQASRTPTSDRGVADDSVTPEISFQGVLPSLRRNRRKRVASNLLFSEESPLTGAMRMDCTSGDESFYGFSPNTVLHALPVFASPSPAHALRKSPRKVSKLSVDSIALRLASRLPKSNDSSEGDSRLGRKRNLELSDEDLVDPQLSPPPSKKRRVSVEAPPSSPTLRPRMRRSPRLASSRKLRSSSCD